MSKRKVKAMTIRKAPMASFCLSNSDAERLFWAGSNRSANFGIFEQNKGRACYSQARPNSLVDRIFYCPPIAPRMYATIAQRSSSESKRRNSGIGDWDSPPCNTELQ